MLDIQRVINSFPPSIKAKLRPFYFKKGETIIRKGDNVDFGYFVIDGTFDTIEDSIDGKKFLIAKDQSEFICMMDIFSGNNVQCATIIARTDCVGYKLSKKACMDLLDSPCLFQPSLIRVWARKFYETTTTIYRYPIYRTKTKLITNVLHNGVDNNNGTTTLSIPRDRLADTIGCSRRTLFRVLQSLKEDGLITTAGSKITVDKEKALQFITKADMDD